MSRDYGNAPAATQHAFAILKKWERSILKGANAREPKAFETLAQALGRASETARETCGATAEVDIPLSWVAELL